MCEYSGDKPLCAGNPNRVSPCGRLAGSETLFPSQEHVCWDPKDGELCLCRAKSRETLMEARSDTDVQIVRLT